MFCVIYYHYLHVVKLLLMCMNTNIIVSYTMKTKLYNQSCNRPDMSIRYSA